MCACAQLHRQNFSWWWGFYGNVLSFISLFIYFLDVLQKMATETEQLMLALELIGVEQHLLLLKLLQHRGDRRHQRT